MYANLRGNWKGVRAFVQNARYWYFINSILNKRGPKTLPRGYAYFYVQKI